MTTLALAALRTDGGASSMTWPTEDYRGLYRASWKGEISAEAMKHPAKFARGLIMRLYEHAVEQGWLRPGDHVLDCFGGVALGSLDAMRHGLHWHGCELEARFVAAGQANIAAWQRKYAPVFAGWGTAELRQGDSRRLRAVLGLPAASVISSPPYGCGTVHGGAGMHVKRMTEPGRVGHRSAALTLDDYGPGPANLGNLPAGPAALAAVLSSPPYAEARIGQESGQGQCGRGDQYGASDGQLGAMPGGDFAAAMSSPPFSAPGSQPCASQTQALRDYEAFKHGAKRDTQMSGQGNLAQASGETFWSAAREIVNQTYQALRPGGHALWVVKAYVRDRQLVDFPDQWRQLCESAGFVTRHCYRCWLVDEIVSTDLAGQTQTQRTEYKSFFRRLNEAKGSPRIDFEVVWHQQKPA